MGEMFSEPSFETEIHILVFLDNELNGIRSPTRES
jgi:hypothetical protein